MSDTPDLFERADTAERAEAARDLDNVIEFRKRGPEDDAKLDALARKPRETGAAKCRHNRKRFVDEELRTVTCGECGEKLDPIWCLLNLIEFRESLRRERQWIEHEKEQARKRQERAVARRVNVKTKREAIRTRENCRACSGTGWISKDGRAARCGCRTTGAKLL